MSDKSRITKQIKTTAINPSVDQLEEIKELIKKHEDEADKIIQDIRLGFQDVVVVFIDLVDSTRFKIEFQDEPEKWILRLMQFSKFLTELIENSNGKVVKYIGDEVMAVFDQGSKVNDALNLVNRIEDIQEGLGRITGHETKVKIAMDKGNVYLVEYAGHNELDPQGTAVDRCARIAKYAQPGKVITSFEYQMFISKRVLTYEIGKTNLKGLGETTLFQLFEQTIQIEEKIEISRLEYDKMCRESESLNAENSELLLMNQNLQDEFRKLGVEPSDDNTALSDDTEDGNEWNEGVKPLISNLLHIIKKSGVPRSEYARFLFLFFKSNEGQKYNIFEGKKFDTSIESNLVSSPENNDYYILNIDHKLNRKALDIMHELEGLLQQWTEDYPEDDDFEDYDASLKEPKFWNDCLDINVLY